MAAPEAPEELAELDRGRDLDAGGFKSENLFLMNVQGAKSAKTKM